MMSKMSGAQDHGPRHHQSPREREPAVVRGSKVDLVRMIAADLIDRIESSDAVGRASLLLQLRSVQDQIVGMKHRLPALSARPSGLSWVDSWSPPH